MERVPAVFGLSSGDGEVPTVDQVRPSVERCRTKAVSVIELSVHATVPPFFAGVQASPLAWSGGSATVTGRIMSISSWLRMWQCHTYSQPKLTSLLRMGAVGLPFGSMLLNPTVEPVGIIGFSGR